jgi:uncharacterized protein
MEISQNMAKKIKEIDLQVVNAGSLLHDIGRVITNDISHGLYGGIILNKLGIDQKIQRIAETHVLGGFTFKESKKIGLPPKDYLPRKIEEKICCYADKRFQGQKKVSIEERFRKWFDKYGETELLKNGFNRILEIEKEITKI